MKEDNFYSLNLELIYTVTTQYYYGPVEILELKGLIDEIEGGVLYTNKVVAKPIELFSKDTLWDEIDINEFDEKGDLLQIVAFEELISRNGQ